VLSCEKLMTPEDWKEAWNVYQIAGELFGPERELYLHTALADNPTIRGEVLRMLGESLEISSETPDDSAVEDTPAAIGPYRLIKRIGEGGMGTVYLAEQERPLRRRVALKLIRNGLHTREVLARFEIERQALAMLDHPNIARVFDAGATEPHGHPFFVMEFVDGLAINRYCEERGLDVRGRLGLIQQVCEAIQHAHSKAIIHRDIKPANVLVTEQDGRPVPRVIDFGVAKAFGTAGETMSTSFGSVVGTLQYMSPEQAIRSPDLDARTDIYSVGVLLYELLTGTTPISWEGKDSINLPLALKQIAEAEPVSPSRRVRETANSRRLSHTLQGEIDWIVMKALDKDPDRRYRTANALGHDIQRYLDGELVEAGPPSRSYRMAKLARRYRTWLATAAVFVLILITATLVSLRETFRAVRAEQTAVEQRDRARIAEAGVREERDRAQAAEARIRKVQEQTLAEKSRADGEAATARAVAAFLEKDLLAQASPNKQAGPSQPPDPNLTVRAALDRSAAVLADRFQGQPAVRASLEHTIANAYLDLTLIPQAREHAIRAVDLRTSALGTHHPETLASMDLLAMIYRSDSQFAAAEKIWNELYRYQRATFGEANAATLKSMHSLAALYRSEGRYKQSAELYERVFKMRRKILGPEDEETMRTANNLAYTYMFLKRDDEARILHEENLKLRRKVLGAEHPDTLISMSNLALVYQHLRRYDEAQALLEQSLSIQRRRLGPSHASTLATMLNLGMLLRELHKLPQSEKVYRDALELSRNSGQEKSQLALTMMNNLGNVYFSSGQFARAEELLQKSWTMSREILGADHPDTLRPMINLGNTYLREEKYQEAEPLIHYVVEARQRLLGADAANTVNALASLVDVYLGTARYAQAAPLARQVWEVRKRVLGEENMLTVDSLVQRTRAAVGLDDDADARTWGSQALAIRRRVSGNESADTLDVVELLALNSLKAGRATEAEESFALCLAARQHSGGDAASATLKTMLYLASSLEQQGKKEQAETLRQRVLALKATATNWRPVAP
jgi:serine/threonine protein kinase/tetratricopeptide (TPR) repeat protein